MIKRKGKMVLLLVFAIVLILVVMNFTTGVRVPTFDAFRVERFCIYKGDSKGENLEVKKCVKIEGGKATEDKIDLVVEELQKDFLDIKLKVVGYDNVSGKKILILDLEDKDVSVDNYLDAGSTGSRINLGILVNSLLQNGKRVSNWIDGVKILVNGEEGIETSHVSLEEIFYREKDKIYLQ